MQLFIQKQSESLQGALSKFILTTWPLVVDIVTFPVPYSAPFYTILTHR